MKICYNFKYFNNKLNNMFKKKKTWFFIFIFFLILFLIIYFFFFRSSKDTEYTTVFASSGPLTQTVIETGTVKPVKEVNLNFLSSGRLVEINIEVGDNVEVGDILAKLDSSSLEIRKLEAEAGLQMARANLSKVLAGVDQETVAISERSLEQAKTQELAALRDLERLEKSLAESISQAEQTLFDLKSNDPSNITPQEQSVISAQVNLDNIKNTNQKNVDHSRSSAIFTFLDKLLVARISMDNVKTLLDDDLAKNVLSARDSAWLTKVKNGHLNALNLLSKADQASQLAEKDRRDDLTAIAGERVQIALSQVRQVLSDSFFMLENTITSSTFPQTSLDAYKSIINSQIGQINLAISSTETAMQAWQSARLNYQTAVLSATESLQQAQVNLNNAIIVATNNLNTLKLSSEQQISGAMAKLDNAKQAVLLAEAQLASTISPVKQQDIDLARAQIAQAEASIAAIDKQIEDSQLTSPLAGIVTAINYSVGEQFSPGAVPMVSILVNNIFEIEVDISESDINKVKIGDPVEITLDAFGRDTVFAGEVYFIEPAQTVIQGVVYYKVKIMFTSLEDWLAHNIEMRSEIKAGMTANVEIMTAFRDKVISVPARAIIDNNGQRIVRLLINEQLIEVPVTIGLRGDDGLVEITDGIKEGDEIITFIRSN